MRRSSGLADIVSIVLIVIGGVIYWSGIGSGLVHAGAGGMFWGGIIGSIVRKYMEKRSRMGAKGTGRITNG